MRGSSNKKKRDREVQQAEEARPAAPSAVAVKQKVLVISTRAINARSRHLMEDFRALLPHGKKDSKIEAKDAVATANDMCELQGCNKLMLFETKRKQDLYIHMSCFPSGPSVKFLAINIHTMLELNFSGNHLRGSRPVVSFDAGFDQGEPHWTLIKEILAQMFSTPKHHKRSKPFVDHVVSFSRLEDSVWMRNYQISQSAEPEGEAQLIEVGPRVTLTPVRIFEGSLRGATLWKNSAFVAPNLQRREAQNEADAEKVRDWLGYISTYFCLGLLAQALQESGQGNAALGHSREPVRRRAAAHGRRGSRRARRH
jgi:ribosome biogenesis protein BRX1